MCGTEDNIFEVYDHPLHKTAEDLLYPQQLKDLLPKHSAQSIITHSMPVSSLKQNVYLISEGVRIEKATFPILIRLFNRLHPGSRRINFYSTYGENNIAHTGPAIANWEAMRGCCNNIGLFLHESAIFICMLCSNKKCLLLLAIQR